MSRPILYGALFASLALNVFIGGAFVGAQLQKARSPAAAIARGPAVAALRALPPHALAAWRETGPAYAHAYGPKAREARRLAREAMLSFGDEPFEAQDALDKLGRARDLEREVRVAQDRRIVSFAATLPQAERKRFGEALSRPRLGRGGAPDGGGKALPDR